MKNHLPIFRTAMLLIAVLACLSTVQANDSRINPDTVYTVDYEIPSYIIPAQTEANKRMLEKARNLRSGRNLLERLLSLNENTTAVLYDSSTDIVGGTHESYREYYNDIEVDGTRCVIHYNQDGEITSINGNFRTINNLNTTPAITEAAALQAALDDIGAEEYAWENTARRNSIFSTPYPQGTLVVYANSDLIALAYRFEIVSVRPYQEYAIFIDAQSGKVLAKYVTSCQFSATTTVNTVHSGSRPITTEYNSGNYMLRDYTRGNGIITLTGDNLDYYSSDNTWGTMSNYDRIALDAHWGAGKTYDYFLEKFQRNSYDSFGGQIKLYVNDVLEGENASWHSSSHSIHYGRTTTAPFVDLDITAHEIMHGVTDYTSGLIYSGESGALDEAMSDVMAVCVEKYAKPNNGDSIWIFGENVKPGGVRNLSNPVCRFYKGTGWYDENGNEKDIHYLSGVFSYWFYLLAAGGSGTNEVGINYSVEGIGLDNAIRICYQMNKHHLRSNSNYFDACLSSYLAAEELGYSSYIEQIRNAWTAVGVEMLAHTYISGSSMVCGSTDYTYSIVSSPYIFNLELVGPDAQNFAFITSGDTCTVTPLVSNQELNAFIQLSVLYHGKTVRTIQKKIFTHGPSLSVFGLQDDYDNGITFYPSYSFNHNAYNAGSGYSSSQILILSERDTQLTSSRFRGMNISFSGSRLPTDVVHIDSCVYFHTAPYALPLPFLRGGDRVLPIRTGEYELTMNVTSDGGCNEFTLNFLVSTSSDHAPELYLNVSGNTLHVQLTCTFPTPIGGGLYQQPTWDLLVIVPQTGEVVRTQSVTGNSTTVNLYGLSSGIYVVRAVYNGNTYSSKFLR